MATSGGLVKATVVGTALQLLMVLAGHLHGVIAALFGPLGMGISLVAGVLAVVWGGRTGPGAAVWNGTLAGGICALVGIVVSFALGDVTALILVLGTLSSAVAGALGGLVGRFVGSRRSVA